MALDEYAEKLANDIGKPATFWHLCNIRSAYYHKYGRYPPKEEFDSFGRKLVGVQPRPSVDALKVMALDEPKEGEKQKEENKDKKLLPFNKKYKIWK